MRLDAVVFLEVEDVRRAHTLALARHGGLDGLRDAGALKAAVMAPRATFGGESLYPSLALTAAAYAFGIARAHAFIDGNKRAALAAAGLFLGLNGYPELRLGPEWVEIMLRAASEAGFSRDTLAVHFSALMGDPGNFETD